MATPSNCGNYLKLRLPTHHGNMDGGRGNDLGYGKNGDDTWLIRSQAPKGTTVSMEKVQRLSGGGPSGVIAHPRVSA